MSHRPQSASEASPDADDLLTVIILTVILAALCLLVAIDTITEA